MNRLIYAECPGAALVILNDITVYHEDDDKGYHQEFTAKMVAERLAKSLGCPITPIDVDENDLGDDWDFDTVEEVALARAKQLP